MAGTQHSAPLTLLARARLDRAAAAAALAGAARAADLSEQPALVAALVDRVTAPTSASELLSSAILAIARWFRARARAPLDADLDSLAAVWDLIPDDYRGVLLAVRRPSLVSAIHRTRTHQDPRARRASAMALHSLGTVDAIAGLVPLLADEDPSVSATADRAFLSLVEQLDADHTPWASPQIQQLGQILPEAIRISVEHRGRGPVLAALIVMDAARLSPVSASRIEALCDWLDGPARDLDPLRAALRGARHPVARVRAWQWIWRPSLTDACIGRLARSQDLQEHECILTTMHLAANPRRAAAARSIARKAGFYTASARIAGGEVGAPPGRPSIPANGPLPQPPTIPELSPRAKWGLPRWAQLIGAPLAVQRAVLDPLLTDPMPGVRLSAARIADQEDLADYCFDADPAVAGTAMVRWSNTAVRTSGRPRARDLDPGRRRLLERLARSPHPLVRRIAADDLELLAGSPGLRVPADADPTALVPALEKDLSLDRPARALAAASIIRRLGLAPQMQASLASLLAALASRDRAAADRPEGHEQDRLAASAVSTLAEVPPPQRSSISAQALAAALDDRDDRVRANAVDGLARDARRSPSPAPGRARLIELKDDPHHRVRASAIRGLIWTSAARAAADAPPADLVEGMLADRRPLHRLAGTWLCERWALGQQCKPEELLRAADRLRDLTTHDMDPRVVARADRAAGRVRILRGNLQEAVASAGEYEP